MSIKEFIHDLLWDIGYDVRKIKSVTHPIGRRKKFIEHFEIDTILDVGANKGQYAMHLRKDLEYSGKIISFEPLSSAFEVLQKKSQNDVAWKINHYALGDNEDKKEINIAGNSHSSSFLEMKPDHLKYEPSSKYIGKEIIEVKRLDSIFDDLCGSSKNIYMKIDTQGYESKVLHGAEKSLSKIDTIQMELSLVPLYDGELLFTDMCSLMVAKGYTLISIDHGFSDAKIGQVLQVDGVFHRFHS